LPALIIGILAMRRLGVSASAWSINLAAAVLGLLIWSVVRRLPPLKRPAAAMLLGAASIATILLPFASDGMLGVHRWISMGGIRLHASAIVAPLIISCVVAAASQWTGSALAIAATGATIMALQPDAGQTTSLAASCAVAFVCFRGTQPRQALACVGLLIAISAASFVRRDPLPPVPHVEGIFNVVASGGPGSAAMATLALFLLTVPFFAAWLRHRRIITLALGVYVAMTLLAPAWGTFPVPIMGYGASPILGYFFALALGLGGPSRLAERATSPSFSSA
jgi:cell division protein FtsW (lipid II flippase)